MNVYIFVLFWFIVFGFCLVIYLVKFYKEYLFFVVLLGKFYIFIIRNLYLLFLNIRKLVKNFGFFDFGLMCYRNYILI